MEGSSQILPITRAVLFIVISYLIGSIPVGLIIARIMGGIDIREHGSGNIGLTNVIRTLGWGAGLVTGIIDFLKGYLPVWYTMISFSAQDFGGVALIYESIVIMVSAVLFIGNLYPVFLLFRGGKGVATGLGIMSALMGVYIFIPLAVFGLILFIFRFVSLASIVGSISVPLTVMLLSANLSFVSPDSASSLAIMTIFAWVAMLLIVWRHKRNISRIFAGTEPRIGRLKEPTIPTLAERLAKEKESTKESGDAEAEITVKNKTETGDEEGGSQE